MSITRHPGKSLRELREGLQRGAGLLAEVRVFQGVSDIGAKKSDGIAAVIGDPVVFEGVKRLAFQKADHGVGELDLAPRAGLLCGQPLENLRLEDVAAGNE